VDDVEKTGKSDPVEGGKVAESAGSTPQPSPPAALAPVAETERIASIDVLRGVALLGILLINIPLFAMIEAVLFNPTAYGDFTGANFAVWLVSYLIGDQKFMTLFSMLFGAGIVLMAERAEAKNLRPAGVHYRRMFWLIVIGSLHGYLLWYGDILYLYGMCGLVVYLFRRLSPRWLIPLGFLSIAVASALWLFFGWSMQFWPEEQIAGFEVEWRPPPEVIEEQLAIYRGGWIDQMAHRAPTFLEFQIMVLMIWGAWRAGGLMLIGMGLHKLGVFSARRSSSFYAVLVALGAVVGLPTVAFGVYNNLGVEFDVRYSFFFGWQFNYWGSILVSLGYVGLVMLICKGGHLAGLTSRLAAVGRMAFTNYLLHTIICTTIFYGHGFGLFGRVERLGQLAIVVAIWVFQLIVSPIWLRHFRFGPFEWLWRTLTYMKLQPMRRR
jgi:uncharacterized protein